MTTLLLARVWEGLTRAEINERFGGGFSRWLSGASCLRRIDQATARRVVQTVPNCSLVELVIRDGGLSAVERA